jgi:hypothetical protein
MEDSLKKEMHISNSELETKLRDHVSVCLNQMTAEGKADTENLETRMRNET